MSCETSCVPTRRMAVCSFFDMPLRSRSSASSRERSSASHSARAGGAPCRPAAFVTATSCLHRSATSPAVISARPSTGGANQSSWNVLMTSFCTSSSSETRLTRWMHASTARGLPGLRRQMSRRILMTRFRTETPVSARRLEMVL
eukprot:scaffold91996_cov63-Phaeocystis_antarctica.AAC.3